MDISIEKTPIYKDSEVNIPDSILDKIKDKKTLIVLNQVKRAQGVYKEIKERLDFKEGKQIVLLHSRFTRKDRKDGSSHVHEKCLRDNGPFAQEI